MGSKMETHHSRVNPVWLMTINVNGSISYDGPIGYVPEVTTTIQEHTISSQKQPISIQEISSPNQSSQSSQVDKSETPDEMMSPVMSVQADGKMVNNRPIEHVWHGEFHALFRHFPNRWTLRPLALGSPVTPAVEWQEYHDSAKVRFQCQECYNGWTSMKGRVVFWYGLCPRLNSAGFLSHFEGQVLFKLFGQKCQKCKSHNFQPSLWYESEVLKVVRNIYAVVSRTVYGWAGPQLIKEKTRTGKPTKIHSAESCEACLNGVCSAMAKLPTEPSDTTALSDDPETGPVAQELKESGRET